MFKVNPIAKDLRTPKYKPRVIKKKNPNSRKNKHKIIRAALERMKD